MLTIFDGGRIGGDRMGWVGDAGGRRLCRRQQDGGGKGGPEGAPAAGAPAPGTPGAAARKTAREPVQKVVFVVEDGKARVRRVETGLASENDIELVSGVKEGEVVVEGPYKLLSRDLADGKPVKDEAAGKDKGKGKG